MKTLMQWSGMIACAALLASAPARAETPSGAADKVLRLDMMLMATSLRCRQGANDFRADYASFRQRHHAAIADARARLMTDYSERFGADDPEIAVDRVATAAANRYGLGHAWLSCGDLRQVTRGLAQLRGTEVLVEAADQLLAGQGRADQLALVRR